jgi:hypothetical protein
VRAADEIVQNFGIAIASTIAGIGLRVIFNQMRRDPVEVERMMRLELAEAARRVRRELDSVVVEFAHHRRAAQQSASDSFNHVTKRFDEVVRKLFASLEDITTKLAAPIEAASRRSADAIAGASEMIDAQLAQGGSRLSAASDALSERATTIATVLDDVTARLGALQTPERVIEVRLEPAAHSFAQAADRLAAQAGEQAAAAKAALETATAGIGRSIELVTTLRQEFDTASAMNRSSLDAATEMIKAMAEVLEEFKASSRSYVEVLGFMLDKTDATMRTFTDVLIKSGVDAARQADGLREVLPAIEASVQSLAAAGDRISGVVEDLRSPRRAPTRETID